MVWTLRVRDSIPPLMSTEPPSSDDEYGLGHDFDSGMIGEEIGNVTNLCTRRRYHVIRRGIYNLTSVSDSPR